MLARVVRRKKTCLCGEAALARLSYSARVQVLSALWNGICMGVAASWCAHTSDLLSSTAAPAGHKTKQREKILDGSNNREMMARQVRSRLLPHPVQIVGSDFYFLTSMNAGLIF